MASTPPIVREIEAFIKARYAEPPKDEDEIFIKNVQGFVSRMLTNESLQRLLQDSARVLHSLFQFKEVSIGLRDPEDGMYRYFAVVGYTREAEKALKEASYTYEEYTSQREFPGIRISKMIEMTIGENQPSLEKEKKCWNRPTQLNSGRKSPDEFTEADYMDVHMYASGSDLVGWIEVSAPKDGKLPSGQTMKRLELFASILLLGIQSFLIRERRF